MTSKIKGLIPWVFQLMAAGVLFPVSLMKLMGSPETKFIFVQLGMEPTGRIIIGLIELVSALFLLTRKFSATGAFLSIGVMCGAIIAHCTVLGMEVQDDGRKMVMMLTVVLVSSLMVAYLRRRQLPFIGNTF